MNLERVAAEAFIEELQKLASEGEEGEKTAAAGLLDAMDLDQVEEFLKQAGFGDMMGGIGRGLVGLGKGAVQGAGSLAAGAGRGLLGAARNAGASVAGAGTGVMNSIKAIPGRIGQGMTNLGQRAEQKLTGMGQSMAGAGAARGARLAGPGQAALQDISSFQKANAGPAAANPTPALNKLDKMNPAPATYKPPMMSMGQQLADSNPFQGMGSSLMDSAKGAINKIRGSVQGPQQTQAGAPMAPVYGAA